MSTKSKKAKSSKPVAKKAVVKAADRVEKNGVARPGEGTLCAKVWDALDKLHAKGQEQSF